VARQGLPALVVADALLPSTGPDRQGELRAVRFVDSELLHAPPSQILARYSAEFTCWRELIQNADDAGATTCELRFESEAHVARRNAAGASQAGPSAEPAQPQAPAFGAVLKNWVFRNDGAPFSGDDWSRLRVRRCALLR